MFRAAQYACALAKYLLRNDTKRKVVVQKLQSLESNMSSGRKRKCPTCDTGVYINLLMNLFSLPFFHFYCRVFTFLTKSEPDQQLITIPVPTKRSHETFYHWSTSFIHLFIYWFIDWLVFYLMFKHQNSESLWHSPWRGRRYQTDWLKYFRNWYIHT